MSERIEYTFVRINQEYSNYTSKRIKNIFKLHF